MASLNETDLERLSWVLGQADGFSLNFVKANLAATRAAVLDQLRQHVSRPLVLVEPVLNAGTLVEQFRSALEAAEPAAALVVSVPEPFFDYDSPSGADPNIVDLNLKRNVLVRSKRCVLFLVSLGALNAISRYAQDLYDFRTLTIEVDEKFESRKQLQELGSPGRPLDMGREANERLVRVLRDELEAAEMEGAGDTLRAAAIHSELARTLYTLGSLRESSSHFQAASELLERLAGKSSPETLMAMNSLAATFTALGRHKEALQLGEKTLRLLRTTSGDSHPNTLRCMANLATAYFWMGRNSDALDLEERTLRLMREKLGASHPETLSSMNNLAVTYVDLGRREEGVKLHEETLRLRRETLGASHTDTLTSMANLAMAYSATGRHQEALELKEETLRLMREELGESHPDTLSSMNNLASTYSALGRHEEALKLDEETLRLRAEKLGESHPDTLSSLYNLGVVLRDTARIREALAEWREALTRAKEAGHGELPVMTAVGNAIRSALRERPELREPGDPE